MISSVVLANDGDAEDGDHEVTSESARCRGSEMPVAMSLRAGALITVDEGMHESFETARREPEAQRTK